MFCIAEKMKFDTNDLKENLKNYQKKATDQFKDFAENDWPNIKDHLMWHIPHRLP